MFDPFALVRAIATLAAAIVVGSSTLIWYSRDALLPAGGAIWRHRVVRAVLISSFAGAVATWAGIAGSAAAAAGISPLSIKWPVIATFLTKTGVGKIAIVEMACALAACVPAVIAWVTVKKSATSGRALLSAALIAGLGLVAYPFNSHPVSLNQEFAGILSSMAHRLALAIWLGGLPALILLIGAGPVADDTRQLAAVVLRRFSRVATVAMGIILATGGLLTWFLVRNFPSLIGTQYGYLLLIKLALLGGVLAIASGLQRKLLPALELKPGDPIIRSYAGRVKIETLLALLILIVASDMAGLAPPEHENILLPLPFPLSPAPNLAGPRGSARAGRGAVLVFGVLSIAPSPSDFHSPGPGRFHGFRRGRSVAPF